MKIKKIVIASILGVGLFITSCNNLNDTKKMKKGIGRLLLSSLLFLNKAFTGIAAEIVNNQINNIEYNNGNLDIPNTHCFSEECYDKTKTKILDNLLLEKICRDEIKLDLLSTWIKLKELYNISFIYKNVINDKGTILITVKQGSNSVFIICENGAIKPFEFEWIDNPIIL